MKNPLLIGATSFVLLVFTATSLYAQTNTSGTIITKMKAAAAAFTLTSDLNVGQTGLTSSPVAGKKTGDILTAAEWNRMLELVSQGGTGSSTVGLAIPVTKTKHKPTTSSSLTFDIPAGSRYATARVLGNATGHPAIGNDENHEAMEIFFDFQNGRSSGIHNLVIGVGANWSYGYTWEDHAFGTRVTLKEGDSTLPAGYEIWANGVRPTVNVAGGQLSISGLSNDYISQIWIVTFH